MGIETLMNVSGEGFFAFPYQTETVDLEAPNGEKAWVRIKKHVGRGDRDYATDRGVKVMADMEGLAPGEDPEMTWEFHLPQQMTALMERMIVDWPFVYPEGHEQAGEKLPVTADNIGLLVATEGVVDRIIERINANNPTRSRAARGKSRGASRKSSRPAEIAAESSVVSAP